MTHRQETCDYDPHRRSSWPCMADVWEREHGLDPSNPTDGAEDQDGDGYTNLEAYLNSLV